MDVIVGESSEQGRRIRGNDESGASTSVCDVIEVVATRVGDAGDGVNCEELGVRGGAGVLLVGCV
ncbi:hypothetical protein GOP47_0000872 [Adiantum capillus-veneris]|uniref:Uncharacterized protein n=1 Tax=Adiantum capillus-veneris TaxID=13818 RepID=A0A9D4VEC3_ADICA|nr:hypothetical protein GOP47_0000872 [Adiantum capillus-veneris]